MAETPRPLVGALRARAPQLVVGLLAVLTAVAVAPPFFEAHLAFGHLEGSEPVLGWSIAGILGGCGVLVTSGRSAAWRRAAALLLSIVLLVGAELVFRVYTLTLAPPALRTQIAPAVETSRNALLYSAHPFLQYVGTPGVHQADFVFNSLGFADREHTREKPPGVVRVAALGGSTTESGYPQRMETWLDKAAAGHPDFEVLNFGISGWTTAHSLVNYVLNVVDYAPDYVVIHHGWNDEVVRGFGSLMRGDYAHAIDPVAWGKPDARSPIEKLALYRLVFRPQLGLPTGIPHPRRASGPQGPFADPSDLRYFRRNIETIIDLAATHGTRVVLTTQPRSTEPTKMGRDAYIAPHIDQCNEVVRAIQQERGAAVLFVDLDGLITGKHEAFFVDLGHTTEAGRQFLAATIGAAILADTRIPPPAPPLATSPPAGHTP